MRVGVFSDPLIKTTGFGRTCNEISRGVHLADTK